MSLSGGLAQLSGEEVMITAFRDVSASRERQQKLHQEIRTDFLTGLGNRKDLQEVLSASLFRAIRNKTSLVVCMLDLDDFKGVNDCFGHAAGDFLLQEMAGRMKLSIRLNDYVARLGGDEFVLILDHISPEGDLTFLLDRLRQAILLPVSIKEGKSVSIGVSLGLTVYQGGSPAGAVDPEELMKKADGALYLAKRQKNCGGSWWVRTD